MDTNEQYPSQLYGFHHVFELAHVRTKGAWVVAENVRHRAGPQVPYEPVNFWSRSPFTDLRADVVVLGPVGDLRTTMRACQCCDVVTLAGGAQTTQLSSPVLR